jgi:hypothetical protein
MANSGANEPPDNGESRGFRWAMLPLDALALVALAAACALAGAVLMFLFEAVSRTARHSDIGFLVALGLVGGPIMALAGRRVEVQHLGTAAQVIGWTAFAIAFAARIPLMG